MKSKQKGFTLIELLVVIAIIGLLAGIVLVSLGGARESAQDARRQTDIRNISTAMELCYGDVGCQGANQYLTSAGMPTAIPNAMPAVPTDPTGVAYTWADNLTTPNTQDYCVCGQLSTADGLATGVDDLFCASPRGVDTGDAAAALGAGNCAGL